MYVSHVYCHGSYTVHSPLFLKVTGWIVFLMRERKINPREFTLRIWSQKFRSVRLLIYKKLTVDSECTEFEDYCRFRKFYTSGLSGCRRSCCPWQLDKPRCANRTGSLQPKKRWLWGGLVWAGRRWSEVWLPTRVLWMCETVCEVLVEHGTGSAEHEDNQSRRCRAPIVGFAVARPWLKGGVPP